jgi:hypothetical protein
VPGPYALTVPSVPVNSTRVSDLLLVSKPWPVGSTDR